MSRRSTGRHVLTSMRPGFVIWLSPLPAATPTDAAAVDAWRREGGRRFAAGVSAASQARAYAAAVLQIGTGADHDVSVVLNRVVAVAAPQADRARGRGERAADAAAAGEAERRAIHAQRGVCAGGDAALVEDDVVAVAAVDAGRAGDRPRVGAGARAAEPDTP